MIDLDDIESIGINKYGLKWEYIETKRNFIFSYSNIIN